VALSLALGESIYRTTSSNIRCLSIRDFEAARIVTSETKHLQYRGLDIARFSGLERGTNVHSLQREHPYPSRLAQCNF